MRKYFVTGFYLLIVGGLLLLGGFIMGGNKSVVWNHGFQVVTKIDQTDPLNDFKNIYIEGKDMDVNIRLGDRYKIRMAGDKSSLPTHEQHDDTLTVTGQTQKNGTVGVGVDAINRAHVTITVPMDKSLNNVHIRLSNGYIRMNDVTIEDLVKSVKDMDYDSNIYMSDVTVNNVKKLNMYDTNLTLINTKLNNANIVANAYSRIEANNVTFLKSNINMDESDLIVKESNFDTLKAMANHSKISISKTTMMNKNEFRMYSSGRFNAKDLTVEGMNLTSENGYVRYNDKKQGETYQIKPDAQNLLTVVTTKAPITIN
ncbi:DUF4097 family beta strand repeat-containing protein [Companilactobacillus sp. HBUAS59544]|uniref:DUF4097 family beta strand repeat-containing protein n=1 Tax=Companilactobacillus sp. HBUAS59544 TaxID=3109363 RepID=UPI002FF00E32